MIPRSPSVGAGVLTPNEVDPDALFAILEQRVAEMIVDGPPADDDGWFWLLLDGPEVDMFGGGLTTGPTYSVGQDAPELFVPEFDQVERIIDGRKVIVPKFSGKCRFHP